MNFIERKEGILSATLRAGRRRAMSTAHELSKGGAMAASAELCNEAVLKLIALAYETDEVGLCNVDPVTGAFEKFPVPWGRSYTRFGLQATEAAVLRLHIIKLLKSTAAPLWTYDPITRRWGVNLFDYPNEESAADYWQRSEVSAKDYKRMLQEVQTWRKSNA